jgi:hypothetical protein
MKNLFHFSKKGAPGSGLTLNFKNHSLPQVSGKRNSLVQRGMSLSGWRISNQE